MQKKLTRKSEKKVNIKRLVLHDNIWKEEANSCIKSIDETHHKISNKNEGIFSKKIIREFEKTDGDIIHFKEYYDDKLIRSGSTTSLIPLVLEDTLKVYFPNRQLKSVSIYENNQLISNENWNNDGSKYIDNIFYSVDETPEYSLGQEHFKYYILKSIQDAKIDLGQYNDKIVLAWVVMEDGSIQGVRRVSGKSAGLSNFLIELIESLEGNWIPAELNGEIVRYFMKIPFNFAHHTEGFDNIELSGGMLIWD